MKPPMLIRTLGFAISCLGVLCTSVRGGPPEEEKPHLSTKALLESFAKKWDDSAWTSPRGRKYIRPLSDLGWKLRMQTLQALVKRGHEATSDLVDSSAGDNRSMSRPRAGSER